MRVPGIAADVVDVLVVRVAERETEQQQDGQYNSTHSQNLRHKRTTD